MPTSSNPAPPVRNLRTVLERKRGQRTNLGVVIPVMRGYLESARVGKTSVGLTEAEIKAGFDALAAKFIASEWHPTYLHRAVGPRGFLEEQEGRFRLREVLLVGLTLDDIQRIHDEMLTSLQDAFEQRLAAIRRLEEACGSPEEDIQGRSRLVKAYLANLTGNSGEVFEVVSFALLREYFRSFGFSLRRFSTTQANDGGIDFVAGEAIYQVSVDPSRQKLRRDLRKAPGTKRVVVRPTVTDELLQLRTSDVLETIDLRDLLAHFLAWLLARDERSQRATHLQEVLCVALEEFRREMQAESA